jgi:hypothetical protein
MKEEGFMTPKNAVTPQSNEPTKANRALTVIGIVLCALTLKSEK